MGKATMRLSEEDSMEQAELAYREALPLIEAMTRKAGMERTERDDVLQRVAVVLVEKAAHYDPSRGTRRMWAMGIARNILLDALRAAREERRRFEPDRRLSEIPSGDLTPEETLRARESLAILSEAVRVEHRRVFELDALAHTAREIGRILDVPKSTAEWRLLEVREDLDEALRAMGEDRKSVTRVRAILFPWPGLAGGPPVLSMAAKIVRWILGSLKRWAATPAFAAAGVIGLGIGAVAAVRDAGAQQGSPMAAGETAGVGRSPPDEASITPPSPTVESGSSPDDGAASSSPSKDRRERPDHAQRRPSGSQWPPALRAAGRRKWMLSRAILSLAREGRSISLCERALLQREEEPHKNVKTEHPDHPSP